MRACVCVDKQRCRLVLLLTELQESITRAAAGPSSLPMEWSQNPPSKSFKQLLTIPQHLHCSTLNRQCEQGRLRALHCLSHLRGLWPRTQTRAHASRKKKSPLHLARHPTLISHLLVHTCAQAAEKWTPGVRSGVIHHAASGRRVDIRKGTRSAAIVIESPCLF